MPNPDRRTFLAASAGLLTATTTVAGALRHAAPIKVGQIGTRHGHASGKMATFRKFPELFEVVGVVEPDSGQRSRVAKTSSYKGLRWMTQQELLGTSGLQAVAVETDIDELLPAAEACIQAGVHVHLDKPAGTSLKDFRRICAAADEKQLMIQMGYMFRGNAAFQFLFKAVRDGWLGDVFSVHCEMSKKVGDGVRPSLARYAGGSMFELGCHLIDAVVTLLGPPDQVTPFNRNTRPEHDNLMDNCLAVFEYPKATATIRSSMSEVDGGRRRQFVACGTKGSIVIRPLEPYKLSLTLESATGDYRKGTTIVELPKSTGRYDGDFQHLAAVVRGEQAPEYSTKHDLAVQTAVLQASGMPIE
ncbi:Gfo/Idh/MocA family protein [Fuerstiella marisgermanici]|uniref:Putative oxidoreductase YvaA n=1 Tax=Fuerstiella marisgermanici TaxID=1891926 RepID=A0A1P8WAQ6_9PLAN|nr:Gfo/Idh/MocA family oxidoreductase [Fuerstiella marisgermanici]APZ91115.1 putative oxidoreductase YvaA [Fuerstiella marisgermanici]